MRYNWLYAGDVGVMHEDGYLEIKDRSKVSRVEGEVGVVRAPDDGGSGGVVSICEAERRTSGVAVGEEGGGVLQGEVAALWCLKWWCF